MGSLSNRTLRAWPQRDLFCTGGCAGAWRTGAFQGGQGMQLNESKNPLASVRVRDSQLRLLAAHNGTEVIEQSMPAGARWVLSPRDGWDALEYLRVLEGHLRWESPQGHGMLGPGDDLVTAPMTTECLLWAESAVRILYICSQPVFHRFCADLRQMMALAVAVESRCGHPAKHCERIARLSVAVGHALGLARERLLTLYYGAYLHDLGKVGVPDRILSKPGPLTDSEWDVMKLHPCIGRQMVAHTLIKDAGPLIEQHHERWDGSGYPEGLRGDDILLEAQIVGVVDSFDAVTSARAYRPARTEAEGVAELRAGAGRLYRADVVEALLQVLERPPELPLRV